MAAVAESLRQPFMPWQRLVAEVGCEVDPLTGLPAYREVVVTVPRQSGKTTLFLAWQINRCVSTRWAHPQRSAFTAQTGKDARDKWIDELFPLIRSSRLKKLVAVKGSRLDINEGMGNESIRFRTGSLIRLLSTSTTSGHSKTLHQAVMDEVWHDTDDRREQGLRPAMVTVPGAQLLVCSTAGTDASSVLNRKVTVGRESVEADVGYGVAYFEWSAPDDWDPEDEDSYFGFMPALCPDPPCRCAGRGGRWRHGITLDVLRAERMAMQANDYAEYRRAYGNRKTSSKGGGMWLVFPEAAWRAAAADPKAPSSRMRNPVAVGISVAPDRGRSAIVAAGHLPDGGRLVEVTGDEQVQDYRPGTGWLVERVKAIDVRQGPCVVVCDDKAIADQLAAAGVEVHPAAPRDVAAGQAMLLDGIAGADPTGRDIHHLGEAQRHMTVAAAAVQRRKTGPTTAVWESAGPDITPIRGAGLAVWGLAATRVHRSRRVASVASVGDRARAATVPEQQVDATQARLSEQIERDMAGAGT